jgi:hypothetical protein
MEDIRTFLVSAPLTIDCADVLTTNTIYVFDYSTSFVNDTDRDLKFIEYIEKSGVMCDIYVPIETPFEDKEKLILKYFNADSFFNIYTLVETMVLIMFVYKNIDYVSTRSILSESECLTFISRNKTFVENIIKFYNSMFLVMLLFSSNNISNMQQIRMKYPSNRIITDELSPNICNMLLIKEFYRYYDKHVGNDMYYYQFLFENNLYKSMSFIDIIKNKSNTLLPILVDMSNKNFLNYINEKRGI